MTLKCEGVTILIQQRLTKNAFPRRCIAAAEDRTKSLSDATVEGIANAPALESILHDSAGRVRPGGHVFLQNSCVLPANYGLQLSAAYANADPVFCARQDAGFVWNGACGQLTIGAATWNH